jgi:uncharacterized membrane protein
MSYLRIRNADCKESVVTIIIAMMCGASSSNHAISKVITSWRTLTHAKLLPLMLLITLTLILKEKSKRKFSRSVLRNQI